MYLRFKRGENSKRYLNTLLKHGRRENAEEKLPIVTITFQLATSDKAELP